MNSNDKLFSRDQKIFQKLSQSPLFATYQAAFIDATGLNLQLVPAEEDSQFFNNHKTSFCSELNQNPQGCAACLQAGNCLKSQAEDHAETTTCFAGLRETLIPIRSANQTIAYLSTGQVFTQPPSPEDYRPISDKLKKIGMESAQIKKLRSEWLKAPVISSEKYQGAITLLAAFALQLSERLNQLLIEDSYSEPEIITKAKQFVCANLEEKVNLEDVAEKVGVSTYYFCKLFKSSTGMTLTEYVNRRRIEWAKRKLLNPQARVTEVAYDVGYQSLSQFNRSFQKYMGMSPTKYREEELSGNLSKTPLAA